MLTTFTLLFLIHIMNFIFAIIIIFLERRNISLTWAWLLVLLLLPGLGFILYILFGQNLAREKIYRLKAKSVEKIKEMVDQQVDQIKAGDLRHSFPLSHYQSLITMNLVTNQSLLTQDNEVTVFTLGAEKFEALFEEMNKAKKHIHLLYYMIKDDHVGKKVLDALVQKAKEGIEVRVLYDDIGSSGLSVEFFRELIKAGGEVFSFFPSKIPYLNRKINYRNHRKIVVIDGTIGFVGGFNIGDEYVHGNDKLGFFRDTHLMIKGSAVRRLQAQFLLDWNVAAHNVMKFNLKYFPLVEGKGDVAMQMVSSGPHSDLQEIKNAFLKLVFDAKESIFLQTPYLVPDDSVLNALKIAVYYGIDVRVMIPRKGDSRVVQWASNSYLGELLEAGVKCYLYEKGFLHAKTLVVDGEVAAVGTANVDNRSFKLNFEISAFLYNKTTALLLSQAFEQDMKDSTFLTLSKYKRRSRLTRVKESCARLLSPLL